MLIKFHIILVFIFMTAFFFSLGSALPRKRAKPDKIQKGEEWMVQDTPENMAAL